MLTIILYLLACIGLLFIFIILFDLWQIFRRKYRRLKKTVWDEQGWEAAVLTCAEKWVTKMPVVPIKDETRFVLLDVLRKQYKHSSAQSWQYALLVDGVCALNGKLPNNHSFFETNQVKEIDEGFAIYFEWKNQLLDDERLKELMKKYISIISQRTHQNGLIEYRNGYGDICLVDALPFVCPLLIKWGYHNNELALVDFAMKQIRCYYESAYIEQYGLYAHAYDAVKKMPCESIAWGRGTGWYVLGLLYCYSEIREGADKEWLYQRMLEAANNIIRLQQPDGSWCTQLVGSWNFDSSATAIFAFFLYEFATISGISSYCKYAENALNKLVTVTSADGSIDSCEGDCHGIGKYSKFYSISPFTQGITLRLIAAKKKYDKRQR